jgi:hypothetical protein
MTDNRLSATARVDGFGVTINLADTVVVNYIDRGRGAEMWMDKGTVVGFNRTRVLIKFPSRTEPQAVGGECLRVVPS